MSFLTPAAVFSLCFFELTFLSYIAATLPIAVKIYAIG